MKNRTEERMTPSDIKIAEFLERNGHMNAFETVTSVSKKVGVSKATIVRFIARQGFKDFAEFRTQMCEEVIFKLESPLDLYVKAKKESSSSGEDTINQCFSRLITTIKKTHQLIDMEKITEAAKSIMGTKGTVYIMGQRVSYGLAHILWSYLRQLRDRVILIDDRASAIADLLIDVTRNDLLIAFTRRRYGRQTFLTGKYFVDKGCLIVLFADSKYTPLSHLASVELLSSSKGLSVFASLCSSMAVIETLVYRIIRTHGEGVIQRLTTSDKLLTDFNFFCTDNYEIPYTSMRPKFPLKL